MSLKRQTLWNMAPLIVVTALNLFSVPLFYRYLGPEMYALWFYVITFNGMFGFADLGLGVAVGRYVGVAVGKGDKQAVREYWGTGNLVAVPLLATMALLFIVLGVTFGPSWFKVAPENIQLLRACFVSGGLALFFNYYGQVWNILLQSYLDFRFSSLVRGLTAVLQVVPGILIAYLTRNPLYINLWSLLISILQLAAIILYCRRHYQLGIDMRWASRARAREMASFVGKTFAMLVVNCFFGSIDRVIVGRLGPAVSFTHYTIAANAAGRLQGLGTSVMAPVFSNTNQALGAGKTDSPTRIYNETFHFMFAWYLFASIWAGLWHPVLLRLWLGQDLGAQIAPLFTPIIVACSLTAIANISAAQLGALNRLGALLGFSFASGLATMAGVYFGWRLGGIVGVAYGFLLSRIAVVAQDIFAIRLLKAGGWLSSGPWLTVLAQLIVGAGFALIGSLFARGSFWQVIPAALHAALVSVWLLRHPLRRLLLNRKLAPGSLPVTAVKRP
jgi:O-antigen/teichoic acid export membrane protein